MVKHHTRTSIRSQRKKQRRKKNPPSVKYIVEVKFLGGTQQFRYPRYETAVREAQKVVNKRPTKVVIIKRNTTLVEVVANIL